MKTIKHQGYDQHIVLKSKLSQVLLLVLGLQVGVSAQNTFDHVDNGDEAEEFVWRNFDKLEDYPSTPEKYADEPGVYLLKEYFQSIAYQSGYNNQKSIRRKVFKVNDRVAAKAWRIIEINSLSYSDRFGLRLIKPDGTIKEYDRSDLIEQDNREYKMALPNLEPGDIIDYYIYDYSQDNYGSNFTVLRPQSILLVDHYPIVKQNYRFYLKKKTFMIFSELNGAPKPKVEDVKSGDAQGLRRKIIFEDTMRDKLDVDARWVFPMRLFPIVRYQIAFGPGSKSEMREKFFDREEKATVKRSEEDIKMMIKDRQLPDVTDAFTGKVQVKKAIKMMDEQKITGKKERIEFVNNYLRYMERGSKSYWNMFRAFSYFLSTEDIAHDMIHFPARTKCDLDNTLARSDLNFALKIYVDNDTLHWYGFRRNTTNEINLLPWYGFGVKAYANQIHPSHDEEGNYTEIELPNSNPEDHYEKTILTVRIDGADLKISASHSEIGEGKSEDSDRVLTEEICNAEDKEKLKLDEEESSNWDPYRLIDTTEADYYDLESVDFRKKKRMSEKFNFIKNNVEYSYNSFEMEDLDTIQIEETGRYGDNTPLSYSYDFTLKDFVISMGERKIYPIGKLIGNQVNIADEELDRKSDVCMGNARQYLNEVYVAIPAGYEVKGLEELNTEVDTPEGRFTSTAVVEGDKIVIKTQKVYKKDFVEVENWKSMVSFLDAAYDFTQKKVLLQKK